MKRLLFAFLTLSIFGNAQKLAQANAYFERYEYERAAAEYEKFALTKPLPLLESKRLAYSYYTTGNYDRCFGITDSLIKVKDIDAFFIYAHAISCMYRTDYTKAKTSFERYKKLDDEFEVDLHIASCDSLMIWKPQKIKNIQNETSNHSKANINGFKHLDNTFVYHETGVDSAGHLMNLETIDFSEVVFTKPYVVKDDTIHLLSFPSNYQFAVINSLCLLVKTGKVIFTMSEPVSEDILKHNPHLFIGNFQMEQLSVTDIEPFQFSGFQDTASCAYATVNDSENMLVFTRIKGQNAFSDLYVSKLDNGGWSSPQPLEQLNTVRNEFAPVFSGDTLLSFSSDGRPGYGDLDIFTVNVKNQTFGEITHLKEPFNSFHDDFNYSYLSDSTCWFTSNRMGGKGDDDIYTVTLNIERPKPIDSTQYHLDAFVKNWKDITVPFDFSLFSLKNIRNLDTVVANLLLFPSCSLLIEGHTDNIGTPTYNNHLGYFRADAVKKALIKKGIPEHQIKIISKGEMDPPVNCTTCTTAQQAANRVAIIKLVINQNQ
jgi:outer membrane protein OmpA-like peptidoglycan-associated protein